MLRDAGVGFATSTFAAVQTAAPSLGVEVIPVNMREASEIERSVTTFARSPNGGLIPSPSAAVVRHRDLIVRLAARHKLPAVYWERFFVAAGGLISYGPDLTEQFRQAAGYVDRILKGEKPADLPVQARLIGAGEQRRRNFEAKRPGGLEIDDQLVLGSRARE